MFNVSVSAVQKCTTESATSNNCIHEKEADNTSGKTNICKNFIKMNYGKNICILIYVKKSMTKINSHNIHFLSNV